MKQTKNKQGSTGSIRQKFIWWIVIIIASSVGFYMGVEIVLAHFGLLGEVDSVRKVIPSALTSLVILPFGIGIAVYFLRYPMCPIKKLIHGMNRLAEGHYEERLEVGKIGAMKELEHTFNTLATELSNTEMLRSDFVNNFSHEFKTPIVSIHGFARLLQKSPLTPEQQEYVDVIASESKRLADMATNVLHLSQVENQSILTNCREFNLSEQLRKCILLLEKRWTEKSLEIDASFGEHMLSGDEDLLQHVWINLLDNAVKFSPRGAELSADIVPEEDGVAVSITNHGPMISQEDQQRLFDKFWQGDASHASQGTGIGLSVVKRIVELHKGRIDVSSTPAETVFTVHLPNHPRE
ncbi:MAG: HAMP domain-containing histidine kinase [Clostridia bacterium]|nr:HAMP domain-containing histidine kinase [Clostridia bacterium]